MSTPWQKVHEMLMSKLPVRTHYAPPEMYEIPPKKREVKIPETRYKRAVIVDGVRYGSIREAALKTGITRYALYQRIHRKSGVSYTC